MGDHTRIHTAGLPTVAVVSEKTHICHICFMALSETSNGICFLLSVIVPNFITKKFKGKDFTPFALKELTSRTEAHHAPSLGWSGVG